MSSELTPTMGEATEPCRSCGALLAADQRYCLNCGQRCGDPRIDFRAHLPGPPAASNGVAPASPEPPPAAPPSAAESQPQRDYTPLAAVGGTAVLGLMLLVGVLIGQGNSPSTTAPPAQVIVPAGAGGGAATAGEEGTGGEATAAAKTANAAGKAKAKGKKADDASSLLNSKGGGPVVASDEALQELEEGSGADYSENSAKLPDEIATGGAPPPKDNKAPGGGSKGTAIE